MPRWANVESILLSLPSLDFNLFLKVRIRTTISPPTSSTPAREVRLFQRRITYTITSSLTSSELSRPFARHCSKHKRDVNAAFCCKLSFSAEMKILFIQVLYLKPNTWGRMCIIRQFYSTRTRWFLSYHILALLASPMSTSHTLVRWKCKTINFTRISDEAWRQIKPKQGTFLHFSPFLTAEKFLSPSSLKS